MESLSLEVQDLKIRILDIAKAISSVTFSLALLVSITEAEAFADTATRITSALDSTCAVTESGALKCWGGNNFGQLGNGTYTRSLIPVDVTGLISGVQDVSGGELQNCALTLDGAAKCWGSNNVGQLGSGDLPGQKVIPVAVIGLSSGVQAVAAGTYHSCAIATGGGVKCWGDNYGGQLGNNQVPDSRSNVPVDVIGLGTGITAITAGAEHTCAITSYGGAKCWGDNRYGQLGNGTTTDSTTPVDVAGLTSGVQAIDAGNYHTCAITINGGLKCWGSNALGYLGNGGAFNSISNLPVDVIGLTSGVQAVSAGGKHTCAIASNGGLKCWGDNTGGELGYGENPTSRVPVNVIGLESGVQAVTTGYSHTCAIANGGGIKCWGGNGFGQLGNGSITSSSIPVDVTGFVAVIPPDNCADDPNKTEPGICGCGIPDQDTNSNGMIDCQDTAFLVPIAPSIKKTKKALTIKMQSYGESITYNVLVKKGTKKFLSKSVATNSLTIKKLKAGQYSVVYSITVGGIDSLASSKKQFKW